MESLPINLPHHEQRDLCKTRAPYRQGNKLTSVKVYTVNQESQHLLIYNVPAIKVDFELHTLCQRFGEVMSCTQIIPNGEIEDFTQIYHIHYGNVQNARYGKRQLDNRSFYGGILHVCYAPELETIEETKAKLITRRKEVAFHLRKLEFPQQFRPPSLTRGLKRKFQEAANEHQFPKSFSYNTVAVNQVSSSQSIPKPGPSKLLKTEKTTVDVEPFKKLIPTKVSRIVFHKPNVSI